MAPSLRAPLYIGSRQRDGYDGAMGYACVIDAWHNPLEVEQ